MLFVFIVFAFCDLCLLVDTNENLTICLSTLIRCVQAINLPIFTLPVNKNIASYHFNRRITKFPAVFNYLFPFTSTSTTDVFVPQVVLCKAVMGLLQR